MYAIDNKFEIGEECYSVYRRPVHYECPVCKGNGKFLHNGYDVWCRNCNGSGKLHNSKQYVMDVCEVKVRRITASICNDVITLKYKVDLIDDSEATVRNRPEYNLFKTAIEARRYCFKENTKPLTTENKEDTYV